MRHFPNLKYAQVSSVFKFGGREVFIQALFSSFEFCTDGFVDAKLRRKKNIM